MIGGGVAGLETVRVCAERGHTVTLCEKTDALGGNLIPGGVPHFKRYDHKLIHYYQRQMELLGVDVKYNTMVDADTIKKYTPDVIVCATGSTPRSIQIAGDKAAVSADQVLLEKASIGNEICIIGGGLVGCETALWLAEMGKRVM